MNDEEIIEYLYKWLRTRTPKSATKIINLLEGKTTRFATNTHSTRNYIQYHNNCTDCTSYLYGTGRITFAQYSNLYFWFDDVFGN